MLIGIAAVATFLPLVIDSVRWRTDSDELLAFSLAFPLSGLLIAWMGRATPNRLATQFAGTAALYNLAELANALDPIVFILLFLPLATIVVWLFAVHRSWLGQWPKQSIAAISLAGMIAVHSLSSLGLFFLFILAFRDFGPVISL
jgi:hypothetical protein